MVITDADMDKVSGIAKNVSEIESVDIGEFDVKNAKSTEDKEDTAPAPEIREAPKAAPAVTSAPAAKTAAAPAAARALAFKRLYFLPWFRSDMVVVEPFAWLFGPI